jgi:hypothetical protein
VADEQVFADIQQFVIPPEFLSEMTRGHTEADVVEYRFGLVDEPEIHSGWLLTYYGRTPFFCIVFRSIEARRLLQRNAPIAAGGVTASSSAQSRSSRDAVGT